MSHPIIVIENLSKCYANSNEMSLDNISLKMDSGEKIGILGPNGAGKTTLISIICGIMSSSSGKVKYYIQDNEVTYKSIRNRIGFVPQNLALYNELTAFQNFEYFGALYRLSKKQIMIQYELLFPMLGLTNVADRKVKTFSDGMKRRLNLLIGIIHNPDVLLLDEPTVGVDIQSRNAIISFLNKINGKGTTIIYTSHHMGEAEQLCNKIAILDYGNLIAFGKTKDLLLQNNVSDLMLLLMKLTGEGFRDNV